MPETKTNKKLKDAYDYNVKFYVYSNVWLLEEQRSGVFEFWRAQVEAINSDLNRTRVTLELSLSISRCFKRVSIHALDLIKFRKSGGKQPKRIV